MKAKFIYTALIAVMFLSANVYSQRALELKIGPEAGINIASFSSTPDFAYTTRTGLIIGANFEIGFNKNFSVQPGVRYIMKGAGGSDGAGGTFTTKLNYLDIPVLLKVNFPLSEVTPYLLAGPVLSINMSASQDDTPNGGTTTTTDVSAQVSGSDFGILFGGGVGFAMNKKIDIYAQFGYQLGLSNILKNNTTTTLKNNGIQLTAGVMFDI